MDIAQSKFMAKVEELFNNRNNADVTLYCEGESIMAHSSILEMRWDTGIRHCVTGTVSTHHHL